MISFECNESHLSKAAFGGDINTLCAEISFEISLLYGAIASKDEEAGKEFKMKMLATVLDGEIRDKIFSKDMYKAVTGSESHIVISVGDMEELKRQLQELLGE